MLVGRIEKRIKKRRNKMGVTVYINHVSDKARIHEDDCPKLRQHGGGGNRGEYRYFNCYEDAEEWLEDNYEDYNIGDCHYCSPESESCY
jgi:hypothetical protein